MFLVALSTIEKKTGNNPSIQEEMNESKKKKNQNNGTQTQQNITQALKKKFAAI